MQDLLIQIRTQVAEYAPSILGAVAILLIGWLAALALAFVVRAALRRTKVDDRIRGWTQGSPSSSGLDTADGASKIVFFLAMAYVFMLFFQSLGLTQVTEPLSNMLSAVFSYIPRLLGGLVILGIGWIVATAVRIVATRIMRSAHVDESAAKKISSGEASADTRPVPLSKSAGDAVFWLILLLFLPAALGAFGMEGLLRPVQDLMSTVLAYLPRIFAAALLLLVGWFVARVVQKLVVNLLASAGVDKFGTRMGISQTATYSLSSTIGIVVYALILIPVAVASLNALELRALTDPASQMLNTMLSAIPALFAAAVVIVLAYVVGRFVSGLVARILAGVGFDGLVVRTGIIRADVAKKRSPSSIAGTVVMAFIVLLGINEAAQLLNFNAVSQITDISMSFAARVIFGLAIMAVGVYLANLAHRAILAGGSPHATLFATVARGAVFVLVGAMALREMGFANSIIETAFTLLLGAVSVAAAIAFGVGGREWAGRHLESWRATKSN